MLTVIFLCLHLWAAAASTGAVVVLTVLVGYLRGDADAGR